MKDQVRLDTLLYIMRKQRLSNWWIIDNSGEHHSVLFWMIWQFQHKHNIISSDIMFTLWGPSHFTSALKSDQRTKWQTIRSYVGLKIIYSHCIWTFVSKIKLNLFVNGTTLSMIYCLSSHLHILRHLVKYLETFLYNLQTLLSRVSVTYSIVHSRCNAVYYFNYIDNIPFSLVVLVVQHKNGFTEVKK